MSGFEVAGVVLGAIPLVIAALEHYQAGKGAVASFVKYGGLLEQLIFRLTMHQHLYHSDILSLLQAAGVAELDPRDRDTVAECLQLLKDPGIGEEIREWLGPLNEPFRQLMGRYESLLKTIVGHIKHIQRLPHSQKDDLESLLAANPPNRKIDFMERVSFTIKRGKLRALYEELDQNRLSLGTIIEKRKGLQEFSSYEPSQHTSRIVSRLIQIRRTAYSLSSALHKSCCCRCVGSHKILFRLESRIPADRQPRRSGQLPKSSTTFNLVLSIEPTISSRALVYVSSAHTDLVTDLPPTGNANSVPTRCPTVRFAITEIPVRSVTPRPRAGTLDLCRTVRDTHTKGAMIRLQLTADVLDLEQELEADEDFTAVPPSHGETLRRILEQGYLNEDIQLTFKQRTILALDIAASILQLQQTSWLVTPWDCTKIKLLAVNSPSPATGVHAQMFGSFVEQEFAGSGLRTRGNSSDHRNNNAPEPKAVLLELAILLLEIWTHRTLEMWAEKADQAIMTDTPDRRLIALIRWLDATSQQLPSQYETAARQCVAMCVEQRWGWDDVEFQKRFGENVVKPLLDICKVWD
ncbi:hypothetical protein B0T21DRAFT_362935 [Apiosordaria backusii]|uniref:DUF7580 domain-containing protein n=1 Tax=Apiosordaria backusii TaxID=314023 RepID=A0AA40BSL5_9PEZI|nr:hypothetical protein B0T21DRAFT_362935 [Apiosordaria backusii]